MPVSSASPHSGHRSRLRQRLAREPLAVADYEILELLLGYGQPRKDTKPLARELLLRFHNIRGVLDAPPEQLLADLLAAYPASYRHLHRFMAGLGFTLWPQRLRGGCHMPGPGAPARCRDMAFASLDRNDL